MLAASSVNESPVSALTSTPTTNFTPVLETDVAPDAGWEATLEKEVQAMVTQGIPEVWDDMSRRFESRLILAALAATKGRRIDAAQKLGIGRNTITRKIQELGLEKGLDKV